MTQWYAIVAASLCRSNCLIWLSTCAVSCATTPCSSVSWWCRRQSCSASVRRSLNAQEVLSQGGLTFLCSAAYEVFASLFRSCAQALWISARSPQHGGLYRRCCADGSLFCSRWQWKAPWALEAFQGSAHQALIPRRELSGHRGRRRLDPHRPRNRWIRGALIAESTSHAPYWTNRYSARRGSSGKPPSLVSALSRVPAGKWAIAIRWLTVSWRSDCP